jgi:erythromycin esterase
MRELSHVVALLSAVLLFTSAEPVARQSTQSAAQVEAQQLEQHRPIERTLAAKETHAYTIALEAGQFLDAAVNQRGVDVIVRVFAPDGKLLAEIDSPNGNQGDEPIALEAKLGGRYRIEVTPLEQANNASVGRYEIRINEVLSPDAYAKRLADLRLKQQAVVTRLKENGVTIKTVDAGNGFADLLSLKRVFKDVHYVGLGEETHGTREFFQFKHRMLEFLVKEMGFRVFAIEASYSACQNINDYVMGKTDDGAKALDSQGFWTWNTEEVRAMIDWMREYNKSVPVDGRVKFVGFDIQVNDTGKARLLEYLKRVAPERFAEVDAFFKVEIDELVNAVFLKRDAAKEELEKLNGLRKQYNDLFVFLELSGANLAAKSSQAEYEQMREYARVLVQYADAYAQPGFGGNVARDLYMADNFRRIVEREPAGTRFVVWAHNGHIATGDDDGRYPTFGHHLRRFYGQNYYALGFSFNQGSFQSREAQPKDPKNRMLMSFTVGPASVNSVDWFLAQTGAKILFVDFRSSRKSAEIGEWLAAPHPMRSVGSMYAPGAEQNYFSPITLGAEFDGLFFVDSANRARPNPSVKNVGQAQ